MAFSINRCEILGNVSQDPQLRYSAGGSAVCNFSVATNHSIKQQDGSYKDIPTFHNVVVFGKMAEFIAKDVKKGYKIYVEGRISVNSWDDKNTGEKKYRTEIIANECIPMYSKKDQTADIEEPEAGNDKPATHKEGTENVSLEDVAELFKDDIEQEPEQSKVPF